MSHPIQPSTGQLAAPPSAGLMERVKLSEPVRLYLYGVGSIVLLGLVLGGVLTGDWYQYGLTALGVVLGLIPATEAARSSVWSSRSIIRELARTMQGQPYPPTTERTGQ